MCSSDSRTSKSCRRRGQEKWLDFGRFRYLDDSEIYGSELERSAAHSMCCWYISRRSTVLCSSGGGEEAGKRGTFALYYLISHPLVKIEKPQVVCRVLQHTPKRSHSLIVPSCYGYQIMDVWRWWGGGEIPLTPTFHPHYVMKLRSYAAYALRRSACALLDSLATLATLAAGTEATDSRVWGVLGS